MKPLEDFSIAFEPLDGSPIPPAEKREPINPTPNPSDPLFLKNAKKLIERHKGGLDADR